MDPVTLATITGLAGAAKATIDAVQAVLGRAKGREAEKATQEALKLVSDLQARLFELQEVALRLHKEKAEALEENTQLRRDIREKEERAAERQKYQGKHVGRSRLLVRGDDPYTFYCPTCFEIKKVPVTLQSVSRGAMSLTYHCNVCGTSFPF